MLHADPLVQRPALLNAGLLRHALDALRPNATSSADIWRLLTDHYTVDLDAVAALIPADEPEPIWLARANS